MAKEPKANWSNFTKAELVRTIKLLSTRQTKLLNQIGERDGIIAELQSRLSPLKHSFVDDGDRVKIVTAVNAVAEITAKSKTQATLPTTEDNEVSPAFPWENK